MTIPLLTRNSPRPALRLLGALDLPLARLHECCGPARHSFAMLLLGALRGPVLWITPAWARDHLNPDGICALTGPENGPEKLIFVAPERREDLLWCMEEALRSGAAPLIIADLPEPPALTPVRRLHLAAEEGTTRGHHRPLGLILTPGEGGAPGVETRWHMAPAHVPGTDRWHLTRRRARTAPPAAWALAGRPGAWALKQT
ncbi:ImuA family protein [Roseovarius sp.]|uniref:ImuA family protein n=1 Tax=Roseovarius sp. TaxID=1486281 RepID=UPI003A97D09A